MNELNATVLDEEEPFYVYVAGPLSGPPGEYLANVGRISDMSRRLMDHGFCPINPAADLLDGLMSRTPLSTETYQWRSCALLRLLGGKRAALLVTEAAHPDGRVSLGVGMEIRLARELQIPVVYTIVGAEKLRSAAVAISKA